MRRVAQILGEMSSVTAAFSRATAVEEEPETLTGDGEDGPRCGACDRLLPPGTPHGALCDYCSKEDYTK